MKKVYYICHCGSGTSVHGELLELVKEVGNVLTFHINTYDWDLNKSRVITLKAKREMRRNYNNELVEHLDFHSSKRQFEFSFIRELEIPDNEVPSRTYFES